MQILSPYGKDVVVELKDIYGFETVEVAAAFIIHHVQQQYQFQEVSVEMLHIAYGLVAKLRSDSEIYYLKFASRSMHDNPDQLFPWLHYARERGVKFPEMIPASNGRWYFSPLVNGVSDYDVVYLMRETPGKPAWEVSESMLSQYAEAMAQLHRIGSEYPHPVLGSDATWNGKWASRHDLWRDVHNRPFISQDLITVALQVIEETGACTMPQTMLHGDFRFCHVFFQDGDLSGIVDVDQSTQGERFIDLCYGLASGSTPEGGSLLTFGQLQKTLPVYHYHFPLSEVEQSTLRGTFAYAFLETLNDLSQSGVTEQDMSATQKLLKSVLQSSNEALLGCA